MTTEYPYDPALPFILAYSTGDKPLARFRIKADAIRCREHFMSEGVVIDTTPKPKIPSDATIISYYDSAGCIRFASRDNNGEREIWWIGDGTYEYTEQLLEYIGDAEVTVLIEKEN